MFFHVETERARQQNSDPLNMRGKAVVIVGGATEIGRATASLLAARGARVFVTANNSTELSAVLKEVCQWGNEVHGMVVRCDRPEEIRHFFDEATRRLGGIDILVNHLGLENHEQGSEAQRCQDWCTEEGIAHMQVRGRGHIINIGLPANGHAGTTPAVIPVTGSNAQAGSDGVLTSGLPSTGLPSTGLPSTGLPSGMIGALRRQAGELGIRITSIESGAGAGRQPDGGEDNLLPEDIARCVYESIVQPFAADLVLVRGQVPSRTN